MLFRRRIETTLSAAADRMKPDASRGAADFYVFERAVL